MAFIDVDPAAAVLIQACFIPGEVGIVQCCCSHKPDDLLKKNIGVLAIAFRHPFAPLLWPVRLVLA